MIFNANKVVQAHVNNYPPKPRKALLAVRELILQVASNIPEINCLEETLKWGEPSYLTKTGTTLRMDWKPASPDNIYLYVNCQTKLIETFKELYPEQLRYNANRAVVLPLDRPFPEAALAHCIELTFKYHKIKHLPLLGC